MKSFHLLFSDVKDFMANELNCLFLWILIINILLGCWFHFEIVSLKAAQAKENERLISEIQKVKKRVDYRYFNNTRSIEELFDVKINTINGELKQNSNHHKVNNQ